MNMHKVILILERAIVCGYVGSGLRHQSGNPEVVGLIATSDEKRFVPMAMHYTPTRQ